MLRACPTSSVNELQSRPPPIPRQPARAAFLRVADSAMIVQCIVIGFATTAAAAAAAAAC